MEEPDYLIEKFWMGFKVAMIKFYKRIGCIPRPINYWSSILNNYKINKNYDKIQETIYQYITLYMLDMMRYGCLYSSQLLNTFLKDGKNCVKMLVSFTLIKKSIIIIRYLEYI